MDNVGIDYSPQLDEITTLLESVTEGLYQVHSDLTRIFWVIIFALLCVLFWHSIFKHMS